MSYSKTSYQVGDIIKVSGFGPASEKGIIVFMGDNFLTYRGPYYNKTVSAFEITSGKVAITVTSGWLSPSIFASVPVANEEEPEEDIEIEE